MTGSSASEGTAAAPHDQMAAMQRIAEKSRRVAELWLSNGGAKGRDPARGAGTCR